MKNNLLNEGIVASLLVVLAILLLNPFHFWMPGMTVMAIMGGVLVVFAVFASFVLREDVQDEREGVHRMYAGRTAFLAGATVIMLGLAVQSWNDNVDPWLVVALVAMVLAKIGARIYGDKNL